jgi:hypothetical protein
MELPMFVPTDIRTQGFLTPKEKTDPKMKPGKMKFYGVT